MKENCFTFYWDGVSIFSLDLRLANSTYIILGLPIPIVAVTAGVAHDQYGHDKL